MHRGGLGRARTGMLVNRSCGRWTDRSDVRGVFVTTCSCWSLDSSMPLYTYTHAPPPHPTPKQQRAIASSRPSQSSSSSSSSSSSDFPWERPQEGAAAIEDGTEGHAPAGTPWTPTPVAEDYEETIHILLDSNKVGGMGGDGHSVGLGGWGAVQFVLLLLVVPSQTHTPKFVCLCRWRTPSTSLGGCSSAGSGPLPRYVAGHFIHGSSRSKN